MDTYTRPRDIADSEGKRMYGSRPYSDDTQVSVHYSHAKGKIELGPGDFIVLAGIYVKAFFEEAFGVCVEDGMEL